MRITAWCVGLYLLVGAWAGIVGVLIFAADTGSPIATAQAQQMPWRFGVAIALSWPLLVLLGALKAVGAGVWFLRRTDREEDPDERA